MSLGFEQGFLPKVEHHPQPGFEHKMADKPVYDRLIDGPYKPAELLKDKVALITGGDSGIGRSTVLLFALEGAKVIFTYLDVEERDAKETLQIVKDHTNGQANVHAIATDLRKEENCIKLINDTLSTFGGIDILFNNAATQNEIRDIVDLPTDQWLNTFNTNIHPLYYLSKASIKHLKPGSSIINNASVNAYFGRPDLLDYTSAKGAVVSFTRGLCNQYASRGIRVNSVAPGPIQAPLRPATMSEESQKNFTTPFGRPGQPIEVAAAVVFLSSSRASFISGQCIHINGASFVTS